MKLSMWMIANRLSALDPELHIKEEAPVILRSARRAYATNCVHVFPEGKDVICDGEGDYFRLKDMSAGQAFEIIQCTFDFYDDWNKDVVEAALKMDYQQVVDQSWPIFHNPVFLTDVNHKVLAMSAQYGEDDVDEEWRHLSEYGYLSMASYQYMRQNTLAPDSRWGAGIHLVCKNGDILKHSFLVAALIEGGALLGWLCVMEFDRPINSGDIQLLQHLAALLGSSLCLLNQKKDEFSSMSVFWNLICRKYINMEALGIKLEYYGWSREDVFRIYIFEAGQEEKPGQPFLRALLSKYIQQSAVLYAEEKVTLLVNEKQYSEKQVRERIEDIVKQGGIWVGVSLPIWGIFNIDTGYHQAEAALENRRRFSKEDSFCYFYGCAISYIIEHHDPRELCRACHPDVMSLWLEGKQYGEENKLALLKSYLANERSLVGTANALFIHRNTLVYRVKKLLEEIDADLENEYTRDYIKLSIYVLELLGEKGYSFRE